MKPPFWKTEYPFNDFFVFKPRRINNQERLIDEIRKIGLSYRQLNIGSSTCVIGASFLPQSDGIIFSGVAQLKGKFYFGQRDFDNSRKEFGESVGMFTLLEIGEKKIKLTQDFLGCGILFYAEVEEGLVVSNRYHLLLLVLSWIGHKGELNHKKIVANLYAYDTFLGQNVSSEMDIKGVYQLPFDREIEIYENGWSICSKESLNDAFNGCSLAERKQLIEQGSDEVIENISSIFNHGSFYKFITDLSGGYDSRAVFAGVLNIEDAMKKVEIYTRDIPGLRDLEISAGLKNLFGGKYIIDDLKPQYPLTVKENQQIWRSYFMGTYYSFGISPWSPKGKNLNQIRLSGGCGELYRTFWCKVYEKRIVGSSSIEDLASRLVNSVNLYSNSMEDAKEILTELILSELKSMPGDTCFEKFDNHYAYFRNRYHFGMRAFEYFHDCPMWFPLMSKSLFKVSNSMSSEEKQNNKLMLELTENLHPLLIWIDYDSGENKYLGEIQLSDIRFKNCKIQLNSNIDDWKEAGRINNEILKKKRVQMEESFYEEWKAAHEIIKSDMFGLFHELRSYSTEISRLLNDKMLTRLETLSTNTRFVNNTYAKLSSIKDQIDIFGA